MAEVTLQQAREAMSEENSKNLEKYQVLTEIASLRAKLEKKKGGDESPSKVSSSFSASIAPVQPRTPIGIKGFKKAFPELMKMMEEKEKEGKEDEVVVVSKPTAVIVEDAPKVSTLMDRFRQSFPALFSSTLQVPRTTHTNETTPQTNKTNKYPDIGFMDLTGDDDDDEEEEAGGEDNPWGGRQELGWNFRDFLPQ
ncbi:hypothetical protein AA313_de0207498 [Arthrobotrys entomopaga]|nr:hypothetical protein AA313_de0207498 [Arthrobotrys entomopaga]